MDTDDDQAALQGLRTYEEELDDDLVALQGLRTYEQELDDDTTGLDGSIQYEKLVEDFQNSRHAIYEQQEYARWLERITAFEQRCHREVTAVLTNGVVRAGVSLKDSLQDLFDEAAEIVDVGLRFTYSMKHRETEVNQNRLTTVKAMNRTALAWYAVCGVNPSKVVYGLGKQARVDAWYRAPFTCPKCNNTDLLRPLAVSDMSCCYHQLCCSCIAQAAANDGKCPWCPQHMGDFYVKEREKLKNGQSPL